MGFIFAVGVGAYTYYFATRRGASGVERTVWAKASLETAIGNKESGAVGSG